MYEIQKAFARLLLDPPEILNMSVAMRPGSLGGEDETYSWLRLVHEIGVTTMVAAGNFGPLINTMNPLAVSPYVIAVGAGSWDGGPADFSSRGIPGDAVNRPTIVAPGIDLVAGVPPEFRKSVEQRERDAEIITAEEVQRQFGRKIDVSAAYIRSHTLVSGTSAATAYVSGLVARLIGMRRELGLACSPNTIRDVLVEIAQPNARYAEHEVGAGIVSVDSVEHYFNGLDNGSSRSDLWNYSPSLRRRWDNSVGEGVRIILFDDSEFDFGEAAELFKKIDAGYDEESLDS